MPASEPDTKEKGIESEFGDAVFYESDERPLYPGEVAYGGAPDPVPDFTKAVPQAVNEYIGQDFWSPDQEWSKTLIGETPKGSKLYVQKKLDGTGYVVRYGAGESPAALKGWYTTYAKAEAAARIWLAEQHAESKTSNTIG